MKFPVYLTIDLVLMAVSISFFVPLWKRLDSMYRQAVVFSLLFMVALSSFCQYISLIDVRAWRVNPEATYILPFYLGGAPIEEYLFWWFFGLLMVEFYLWPMIWFNKMDKKAKEARNG